VTTITILDKSNGGIKYLEDNVGGFVKSSNWRRNNEDYSDVTKRIGGVNKKDLHGCATRSLMT
jgi:hypothetical protein